MDEAGTIAVQIETELLKRLQHALFDIFGDDVASIPTEGLFTSENSIRGNEMLESYGFRVLGETYDEVSRRYIDGQLVGTLAAPFQKYFASEPVHFLVRAHVQTPKAVTPFNDEDAFQLPLLRTLDQTILKQIAEELEKLPRSGRLE